MKVIQVHKNKDKYTPATIRIEIIENGDIVSIYELDMDYLTITQIISNKRQTNEANKRFRNH